MSTDASLTADFHLLPDDPQLLKQLIADLMVKLSKKDGRIEQLQHRTDLLLRRLYGPKSEKFDPRQATLFEIPPAEPAAAETMLDPATDNTPASEPETSRAASSRPGHGRRKLPDTLKTVEVVHDFTDAEKTAMRGAENLVCIGQEETEQVEREPSRLYRILHIQKKYARKVQLTESGPPLSEKNVILASKPPQPIEGGLPGPLLPHLNLQHPWRRAAEYTLGEWECLVAYVRDGALDIDNNVAERSLRGIALGRRNWLFVGSEQGGHTAALYFSLMATCQRRGVEPYAYLARVFRELPLLLDNTGGMPSAEQLLTLLP